MLLKKRTIDINLQQAFWNEPGVITTQCLANKETEQPHKHSPDRITPHAMTGTTDC